jgi:hypothetical protein
MKFDSVTGVRDRWYDSVLVMRYDIDTHQCTIISRDGLHTHIVSRSSIISSDNQIAGCIQEINTILLRETYQELRLAVDSAIERNLFISHRRVGRSLFDANTNQ